VNSKSCFTFSSSVTLVLKNLHPTYLYNAKPLYSFKSAATTLTLFDRKYLTIAYPNPEAPPVMIATIVASSLMM
jgi:hypothetical protein